MIHLNQINDEKSYKAQRYYLPKGIIKNYNIIVNGNNFYVQPIDSDTKRNEEIRKSTTEQAKDCTIRLDTDSKTIPKIEYVGQLKKLYHNYNATDTSNNQSMFVVTILEKIKETRLKFSRKCNRLIKMTNYKEARV